MKFLMNELNKIVDLSNKSNEELINIFTALAFEVEEIYPAAQIKGVKLAKTFDRIKHPQADTLSFLKTEVNGETIEVVCGADNIDSGQIVAHAIPGSQVGEMIMAPKELRGIISNGMVVSMAEITGVDKSIIEEPEVENIVVFPEDTDLSLDPVKVLELDKDVIDLSILPDRQYAASYFTMAREVSSMTGIEYKWNIDEVERCCDASINIELKEDAYGTFATNVKLQHIDTPMSIKRVLYHSGIKPNNTIQDLSAYTMLMTGAVVYITDRQDSLTLDGRKLNDIDIFNSTAKVTDSEEATLITISSSKRGNFMLEKELNKVFGARNLKGTTTEAAELSMKFFIAKAKELGYLVEASNTVSEVKEEVKSFDLEDSYVFNYLGTEFDIAEVNNKLSLLGFEREGNTYKVPAYRRDIDFKADIVEEIARVYGVENIEPKSYEISNDEVHPEPHKVSLVNITNELSKYGAIETKTYQMVTEEQATQYDIWSQDKLVKLREDYNFEFNTLQTSLMSGLIESYKLNHRNDKEGFIMYELGNVFHNEEPVYTLGIINDDKINEESVLVTKELVLKSLESINIDINDIKFVSKEHKLFNPYISSEITYKDEVIGVIGELHPSLLREHKFIRLDKVKAKLYYAEVQLEKLF